jgi:hypothetical protein
MKKKKSRRHLTPREFEVCTWMAEGRVLIVDGCADPGIKRVLRSLVRKKVILVEAQVFALTSRGARATGTTLKPARLNSELN